jgi:beta-aspartyl-peptidase (threonine type)
VNRSVVIVHGGAGDWPRTQRRQGLLGVRRSAKNGFDILRKGGSSIDAVESAIVSMEDNPIFNAGTGSTLNFLGDIETDAAIMDGRSLQGAGVALVRTVKNPIRLARIVMEKTDHALIAGEGAQRIADIYKLPKANLMVRRRVAAWRRARQGLRKERFAFKKNLRLLRTDYLSRELDTVGALALDQKGHIAAGCSTGGISLKIPGRIGDSAILGAGLYADDNQGAATATGIGEIAIRLVVSKSAADLMSQIPAQEAAEETIRATGEKIGRGLGVITLDKKGRLGVAHDTPNLCWASVKIGESRAGISGTYVER